MENSNNGQDVRRVLCLTRPKAFRRPRAWRFHVRWGMLTGGQELATAQAGAWVLELGPHDVWLGGENYETEYLYRLATGQVVALERPLDGGEVEEITDPQAIVAMDAYRSLDEAVQEEMGLVLERVEPGSPPFALIKCPLCWGTEFATLDFALAYCTKCQVRFEVRYTTGDPGWVVDCHLTHYRYLCAHYILPQVESLSLHMVVKGGSDPRDLTFRADTCGGWSRDKCRPETIHLTDDSFSLRPGLHVCCLGDIYDWKLTGDVPTPAMVREASHHWTIDNEVWPSCATAERWVLDRWDARKVMRAATVLRQMDDRRLQEAAGILKRLAAQPRGEDRPVVWIERFPPVSELGEDEHYLLHHWLPGKQGRSFASAWPVWYVVRPRFDDRYLEGWDVVRKDICPRCFQRVLDDGADHHGDCQELWSITGWRPPGAADEIVQEGETR